MTLEEQIATLVLTLGDADPNHGTYAKAIAAHGFDHLHNKALELQDSTTVRNPAAVFNAWLRRQPVSKDVVITSFNEDNPLEGLDDAIANLQ